MNFKFSELLFLLFLALLLFGPKKLYDVAHQVGAALARFRRTVADLEAQITTEMKYAQAEKPGAPPVQPPSRNRQA